MPRSEGQQLALALGPKFSAGLSLLGSGWIIFEVLRDKKKQSLVYHRLLLGLSILDVLVSSAWFLSTWPVPASVTGLYGNMGNQLTCNIQGFFIQLKAGNPFYNAWLALYFVAVVKFQWTETKLRKVEPLLHLMAISMALGTSTASLVLGLFGNANLWCWIQGKYPMARMFFFYVEYWASFIIVIGSMFTLVATVRTAERETASFRKKSSSFTSGNGNTGKNTRKVAIQALLYIAAYVLTAFFSTTVRTMQAFRDSTPFWALMGMTLFYPMQGFFNFLIYVRPRYLRYRRAHPEKSLWQVLAYTMGRAVHGPRGGAVSAGGTETTTPRNRPTGRGRNNNHAASASNHEDVEQAKSQEDPRRPPRTVLTPAKNLTTTSWGAVNTSEHVAHTTYDMVAQYDDDDYKLGTAFEDDEEEESSSSNTQGEGEGRAGDSPITEATSRSRRPPATSPQEAAQMILERRQRDIQANVDRMKEQEREDSNKTQTNSSDHDDDAESVFDEEQP